jgi:predicted RNA-binding Zn-ribbon protein involved in translation (DUF1610 family)
MEIVDISKVMEWFESLYDSNFLANILKGVFVYLAALWIAVLIWIARDAINRSSSLLFQIFAISLNIFLPVFGLILYLIIRPSKTIFENYYDDLEHKILEESNLTWCEVCNAEIEKEYLYCPECTEQIKKKCSRCHKPFSIKWELCPYCGHKGKKEKKQPGLGLT